MTNAILIIVLFYKIVPMAVNQTWNKFQSFKHNDETSLNNWKIIDEIILNGWGKNNETIPNGWKIKEQK